MPISEKRDGAKKQPSSEETKFDSYHLWNCLFFFSQIKHQIESSINNLQGNLKPGSAVRGFSTNQQQQQPQRPTFEESDDDDDEDESSANSFGGPRDPSTFGPPPSINFGDTERYKRGSQTQERFHKNDKNAGGKNTQKTYRQPLPKIQYDRPGKNNYV